MSYIESTDDTATESLRERVVATWTRGAEAYDLDPGHGLLTPAAEEAWLATLRSLLGDEPVDVLDAGTGTGFLAVLAARLGHRVTGVDLTPAMLERARVRADDAGVDVEWHVGDAMHLPFEDDRFDVVMSRHVLWTMPDPARAFAEWRRVTRPGGRVVWFDGIRPRPGIVTWSRALVSRLVERLQRHRDHAVSHHYEPDVAGQMPFRSLTSTAPIREVLRQLGIEDARFIRTRRIERAELESRPRYRRIAPRTRRYVGVFPVEQ
ncbi:MAG: class I SAM-dependent methyltransferase [Dehalococcoidia bacterium]